MTLSNIEKTPLTEITALINRSENGKLAQGDLQAIKKYLHQNEDLWKTGGDLAYQARQRLYKEAAGKDVFVIASIQKGLEVLKSDLGYNTAPRLEKMLIEEICYCWMAHSITENIYSGMATKNIALIQAAHMEHRVTQSQKRYLRALETLARVRKMLPSIQINIAGQQVNQVVNNQKEYPVGIGEEKKGK